MRNAFQLNKGFPRHHIFEAVGVISMLLFLYVLQFGFMNSPANAIPYGRGGYNTCAYGGTCSISMTTSGPLTISLTPTSQSSYSIQKDSVLIQTENPLGYSLSLESNSASSAALVNGGSSLSPTSGTPVAPQALENNTWGYRVDAQYGFGAGPTSAVSNATSSNLSFAGLTLNGFPEPIYSSNAPTASEGDSVDVWYGVRADLSLPAGNYQQTVVYTATTTP